jgi:RHS repeat-associated protein
VFFSSTTRCRHFGLYKNTLVKIFFLPTAKIENDNQYSIITDYLGTPTHAYNSTGENIWEREIDCYGKTRKLYGEKDFCNYLYQGQYVDEETGLAYNRFRYYDNESGNYISQDPIGLSGGNPTLYGYVKDSNVWIDELGLSTVYLRNKEVYVGKAKTNAAGRYGNKSVATDIFTDIPNTSVAQGVEQITYERMKKMEAAGSLDPMTNGQRPVDMGNKKKTFSRDLGEAWLKAKYCDDYADIVDQKIKEHYEAKGMHH